MRNVGEGGSTLKRISITRSATSNSQNGSGVPFWPHVGPVLFLALIFCINFTSRIILSPLLPTVERDLGISHSQAGLFFLLITAGYFAALLGSGFLSSWLTHRRTIILSSAAVGIALLGISFIKSLWGIRLGLLSLGLASGLYLPSAIATITSLVGSRHWGKAIAIHELAPNLAFIAAPLVSEVFLRWFSWRVVLTLLGGTSVILSLAFARFGRGGEFPGETPASGSFIIFFREPSFWIMVILFGLGITSNMGIFAMLPLYLVTEREMDQNWANTLVALSRVSGLGMAFVAGWASDRLGPKRTIAGSLLLTGITTVLLGLMPGLWVVVAVFLQPALAGCFFPAGFAALSEIGPASSRNVAVSLTVPIGMLLGAGAIPMFIGIMGDKGSFALGFILVGVLILTGAVLSFCLKLPSETSKRTREGQL